MSNVVPVKYYSSSMQGAPVIGNNYGDLIAMLDAVLVDGFNLKSVTSITRSGSVATLTVSGGIVLAPEHTILIAGADQAEYNGEFRVLSSTSTSCTFNVTGTPATPATGTITVKTAPLNFERQFTATGKRAYRSTNVLSNKPVLWIDDSLDPVWGATYAKKGKVRMCQAMSDINTVVGAQAPFDPVLPTKAYIGTGSGVTAIDGWFKWYYSHIVASSENTATVAGNHAWVIVGDDRGFYLSLENGTGETASYGRAQYFFTDFASYRAGDQFNTILGAHDAYGAAQSTGLYPGGTNSYGGDMCTGVTAGKIIMRDYTQIIGPVTAQFMALPTGQTAAGSGYNPGLNYPNGPDYSLMLSPMYVMQSAIHIRGVMPGVKFIGNNANALVDQTIIDSVAGYDGRKFLIVAGAYNSTSVAGLGTRLAFDITGPWW